MHCDRRQFLRSSTALSALFTAGLLAPEQAAARWPIEAFTSLDMNEAVSATLGSEFGTPDDAVLVTAPGYMRDTHIAEVTITTALPEVDAVALLVRQNPLPLAAVYRFSKLSGATITTRLDIYQTSDIIGVVRSKDKLYSNYHKVMVTRTVEPELYDPFDDLQDLIE